MSALWSALVVWYYDFFYKTFNAVKIKCLVPVNFDQPWWKLIVRQKLRLFLSLVPLIIVRAANKLSLLVLSLIVTQGGVYWLIPFFLGWVVLQILDFIGDFSFTLLNESVQSIQFYAYQLLLRVDPIFHTSRDTGAIVAKIDRGVQAYQKILETGTFEITSTLVGVLSTIGALWVVDAKIALLALVLNTLIVVVSVIVYLINNDAFFGPWIEGDDRVKSVALENLLQINLIRATFAGNEAMRRLRTQTNKYIAIDRASWGSFCLTNMCMRILYYGLLAIVCVFLINLSVSGQLSVVTVSALILTYFAGTYDVVKLGRYSYSFVTDVNRVRDLFSFLQAFGKQTFPVLSDVEAPFELPLNKEGNILIEARNLQFQYDPNAQIFNGHSLLLTAPASQKNKLYGIIGPSGIGKTTLLSILGGQLRPTQGTVLLNGIDIYSVDDYARRHVIAIQTQTAAALRGSVRYNLLFGLPERCVFSDDELCDILQKVGIWHVFKGKKALDTSIGEGGLSLSGGQRQRFNFASLYLRARHYKPLLILMDEPTSSLDELSERAITAMIDELSAQSVVFVIAHRLQTIQNAVAILDISLIKETKKMRFYPKPVLEHHSKYYQSLLVGAVDITDGAQ